LEIFWTLQRAAQGLTSQSITGALLSYRKDSIFDKKRFIWYEYQEGKGVDLN